MTYKAQVMKTSELMKMGFSYEYLMRAYRIRGQKFARKMDGTKKNSPIIFDTEEFEKWRLRNP